MRSAYYASKPMAQSVCSLGRAHSLASNGRFRVVEWENGMRLNRTDVITGLGLSGAVALVFLAASRAGMASTGLRGDIEVIASLLFILTLPAGALAALCGRLVLQTGSETAFIVTGGAWILLTLPYGVMLSRGVRRLSRAWSGFTTARLGATRHSDLRSDRGRRACAEGERSSRIHQASLEVHRPS